MKNVGCAPCPSPLCCGHGQQRHVTHMGGLAARSGLCGSWGAVASPDCREAAVWTHHGRGCCEFLMSQYSSVCLLIYGTVCPHEFTHRQQHCSYEKAKVCASYKVGKGARQVRNQRDPSGGYVLLPGPDLKPASLKLYPDFQLCLIFLTCSRLLCASLSSEY